MRPTIRTAKGRDIYYLPSSVGGQKMYRSVPSNSGSGRRAEERMTEGKQIAYFYDTILAEEETELDVNGSAAVPDRLRSISIRRDAKEGSIPKL
jgi:hypothetical protein